MNSVSHVNEHASLDNFHDSLHAGGSVDEVSPYKHNKAFHCFISKYRRELPKFYDKRRFLGGRYGASGSVEEGNPVSERVDGVAYVRRANLAGDSLEYPSARMRRGIDLSETKARESSVVAESPDRAF